MSSTDETTPEATEDTPVADTPPAEETTATDTPAAAEETPAEPEEVREPDALRDPLLEHLTSLLGDAVIDAHILPGKDIWVRVHPDAWADAGNALRIQMGARFFSFLSVIDWLPSPFGRSLDSSVDVLLNKDEPKDPGPMATGFAGGDTRFQVFARVTNLKERWGLTIKADIGDENPSVGTWTKVYAGADWHEREAFEMFGVDFVGHPGLRRLYLPTEFEGTPLRKDFPLLARMVKPWPGIVDVEPMPGNDADESTEEATA